MANKKYEFDETRRVWGNKGFLGYKNPVKKSVSINKTAERIIQHSHYGKFGSD